MMYEMFVSYRISRKARRIFPPACSLERGGGGGKIPGGGGYTCSRRLTVRGEMLRDQYTSGSSQD